MTPIILLSGPVGAGKTTVANGRRRNVRDPRIRFATGRQVYSGDADFPPSVPIPFSLPAPQTDGATTTPFTRSLQ